MKVKALVGFVGTVDGKTVSHPAGSEFELPDGADWLRAGLVVAVEGEAEEESANPRAKPGAGPSKSAAKRTTKRKAA